MKLNAAPKGWIAILSIVGGQNLTRPLLMHAAAKSRVSAGSNQSGISTDLDPVRLDMPDERPRRHDKAPLRSTGLRQLLQPRCEVGEEAAVIENGFEIGDEKLFRPARRSAVHHSDVGALRPDGGEDILRSRQRRRQTVDADDVDNGDQLRPPVPFQHDKGAANRVGEIVMGAGMLRMVDQVAAAARCPPLQAAQLIDQPLEVQELRPAGVEQRQRVAVDVRLRRFAQLIFDAMAAKRVADPFASVSIANHFADAVGLEQS